VVAKVNCFKTELLSGSLAIAEDIGVELLNEPEQDNAAQMNLSLLRRIPENLTSLWYPPEVPEGYRNNRRHPGSMVSAGVTILVKAPSSAATIY
jgi:hypothetical protein